MLPVLFEIGGFKLRTFGLMIALGAMIGIWVASRRAPRFGIAPNKVWDLSFFVVLAGILGARIAFIAQEWDFYGSHTSELFKLQMDGLTSFGGLIGGAVAVIVWATVTKTPLLAVLDTLALPTLAAHAIGRIGCFLNGCCYGHPTTGFPGVHFVDVHDGYFLHQPAQLYDMAMLFVAVALIARYERSATWRPGQTTALMLVGYGVSRFIYEFFRIGTSSTSWGGLPITEAHAMAALLFVAGGVWFGLARRRRQVEAPAS